MFENKKIWCNNATRLMKQNQNKNTKLPALYNKQICDSEKMFNLMAIKIRAHNKIQGMH